MMTAGDAGQAKALDKGRLAGSRRTRYADADTVAGVGRYRSEQSFGFGAVVSASGFNKRDCAGESAPVTRPQGFRQRWRYRHALRSGKYEPSRRLRRTHSIEAIVRI